jgi:broad specificity phosphatase PhoE
VVVVCHGGVIEASFSALGNLALRRHFDLRIDNASITEWSADPGGAELRWRLNRFNDTAHLR